MTNDLCPLCHSPLKELETTKTGKKLQRCSKSSWNSETHQNEGCEYVRWQDSKSKVLKETCPKCGSAVVLTKTRSGKTMKKCITAGWDRENMVPTGCEYIQWVDTSKKELKEECPKCGSPLVEVKTQKGKKMKKCSTAGWDPEFRQPTGCTYVQWLN